MFDFRHFRPVLIPLLVLSAVPAGPAVVGAQPAQPAAPLDSARILHELAAVDLDPAGAVTVQNIRLAAGLAEVELDGTVVPATAVGGQVSELVFLGRGKITLEPPDAIEAGQLELFTGAVRLEETFDEAVLMIGADRAVEALLKRPKVELAEAERQKARAAFERWKKAPERRILNVPGAILADAAGDPFYPSFFAGRFHGTELSDFLLLVDPTEREQMTLGRFEALDATAREKRRLDREIERQQRRGRLIGLTSADLGSWDTWVSASLRDRQGEAILGLSPFEPEKYTLDVTLDGDLKLTAKARVDLRPVVPGGRAVAFTLLSDLEVTRVTDGAGTELAFLRTGSDVTVLLPAPAAGPLSVVLEYSGKPIEKVERAFTLVDTLGWYPHAGTHDLARYEAKFRWPPKLTLLAPGKWVDGGEAKGAKWAKWRQDVPAFGYSFEIGRFELLEKQQGHVKLVAAFDPEARTLGGADTRREVLDAAADALAFFEETFGPYPLDQMTIVSVPRGFSQSLFGFVTLSDALMMDLGFINLLLGLEDRRTVVAHEVAHQWWGHAVGWESYRDQWISEAMANYAAVLYARRLNQATDEEKRKAGFRLGPTWGWQDALTQELPDGRSIASVGPVVLGRRLVSSKAEGAYEPILYKKGAVILDMLARSVGEEIFPKALTEIVKRTAGRPITSEELLDALEKLSGVDLDWFREQYVYGTGLPEIYYTYRYDELPDGKWAVRGEARQSTSYRYRYRLVKAADGRLDVVREGVAEVAHETSTLVVPVQIGFHDPKEPPAPGVKEAKGAKGGKDKPANRQIRGNVILRGTTTPFDIPMDAKPLSFALDRDEQVFGRFFDATTHPKRILYYRGLDEAAAGRPEEAAKHLAAALAAPVSTDDEDSEATRKRDARDLDARIELVRARLALEAGQIDAARASYDKASKVLRDADGWIAGEKLILDARLALARGDAKGAFKRLRKGVLKSGDVESTEAVLLLALAAKQSGNAKELAEAVKRAREAGVDVSLLTGA